MQIAANLSMLFHDLPMVERIYAAADAGFKMVEIQFPYETKLRDLVRAREQTEVQFALINVPPGNLEAGEVGLTCLSERREEYRAAIETCLTYAKALGVTRINSLAGRPLPDAFANATRTLVDNLRYASDKFAEIGATVLVEPVNANDVPGFLFNQLEPALDAVNDVDRDNVKILFDFYHMAQSEPSLVGAIRQTNALIGHVQFADTPGRHEPGTGIIDFNSALGALSDIGYDGCVSAEYWPSGTTGESLGWRENFEKWIA
jgi:hydroxypyruvate isomerase